VNTGGGGDCFLDVIPGRRECLDVIPGRRDSGEPGIFFNLARFRIGAESALTRVFDALWRRPE